MSRHRRDLTHGRDAAYRCPACGKMAFTSRKSARRAAARMLPGQRLRFYGCGPWWHFTRQDAGTVARHREHDAVRPDGGAA